MFTLDSRLQHDTLPIGKLPLSELLLMNDARYPWCILVPRKENAREVFDLPADQQSAWWQETCLVARRMQQYFAAHKMNIATLGNSVSQLHMHVIARLHGDSAWPNPVWGHHPPAPYSTQHAADALAQLRGLFSDVLVAP